jgi:transposase
MDKTATPRRMRAAIQRSGDSVRILAKRLGVSTATVQKWKRRKTTQEQRRGPKRHSSVLTAGEEELVILFRKQTLLSLDDCLYALQPSIPNLTRSSMYRCFQRHGVDSLSTTTSLNGSARGFADEAIGCFFVGVISIEALDGKGQLFIALDRVSKFAFASFLSDRVARPLFFFLEHLISQIPFRINTIVSRHNAIEANSSFSRACAANRINYVSIRDRHEESALRLTTSSAIQEHRYTCERLSAIVEENTLNYNGARRLKALWGRTPMEFVFQIWQKEPARFKFSPVDPTLST